MVQVTNLEVVYKNGAATLTALQGLNFSIEKGKTCAVIGPSGCGKTTLLYILAGFLKNLSGEVWVDGHQLQENRKETAVILQDYGLLPWKTVWENTVLGLKIRGQLNAEGRDRSLGILERLELTPFLKLYPAQLSGGQKQRVAIARALSLKPDLLLMDEPFSSLDAITRESMQELLLELWRESDLTIFLVTHSIEEAVYLGRKILVFSPQPGRILRSIENPYFNTPDLRRQKEYYRLCTLVREKLEEGKNGHNGAL